MRPDGSQKLYPSTSCTPDFGLYYYGSRWYDPALGRFIQPDTIVPDPSNPQDLNRFSYVRNNPLRYTDPTGHRVCDDFDTVGGCYTAPGSPAGGTGGGGSGIRGGSGGGGSTPPPTVAPTVTPTPPVVPTVEIPVLPVTPVPTPVTTADIPDLHELDQQFWFARRTLEVIDYVSSYEDIINTFRPVYKQAKYAFGTGVLEAMTDGIIYGLHDRWSTSLSPAQRVWRIGVVGGQSLLIDQLSNIAGPLGTPVGGKIGEVGVQYIFSAAASEYVLPTTTYWIFDTFNLGVPNDVRPIY